MPSFANLLGFWALLGIPFIILIHFLQRQSKIETVSTLFLLDALDRQSVQGRKFDRIRNSIPLWLQILAVLLLTWLLVEPRWSKPNSVQKIALVFDSSASMKAFKSEILNESLIKELPKLKRGARTVEYTAIDSHLDGASIFNGTSVEELILALDKWEPFRTAHDPGPALRVGRSLVGKDGLLIYVTDHFTKQPGYDAKVLSVGDSLANVGFAGVQVDREANPPTWKALVRNYSNTPQTREWYLASGNQKTATRSITLEPNENRTLQGRFPEGSDRVFIHVENDKFELDDSAPIIIPKPKAIAVAKVSSPRLEKMMNTMFESLENTVIPTKETGVDVVLSTYDPLSPTETEPVSITLLSQILPVRTFLKGTIVSTNNPLMQELNWQGLIARSGPSIPSFKDDEVLLWQGDRPLIFLRRSFEKNQLFFNFDITTSNADKLPAFIILTHRFVEQVRRRKQAPYAANSELNQPVQINYSFAEDAPELLVTQGTEKSWVPINKVRTIKAPKIPEFYKITQGETLLFDGASHFADTREADFSKAETKNDLAEATAGVVTEHTERDGVWRIWLLLLFLVILFSWWFLNRKKTKADGQKRDLDPSYA